MVSYKQIYDKAIYRAPFLLAVLFLLVSWLSLILVPHEANASQLSSRSLTQVTGQPSTSGTYKYTFTYVSSSSAIQSIKFVACTTATATYGLASTSAVTGCTVPTGININGGSQSGTVGGTWTNTTSFSRDATGAANCNPA